ncbi:MAG: methyltransferase domain-containing protein [Candidatus Sungbacteria bacterium]|uniref:Methyltransferase domain-containing protein n=1 Tax=Candidatus Sungiibacteriota bacterium TaxID=2750080 RepID=A0A9D6QUG8_9BACT|nr:methyltransferase domain-containing protein [Candidatus Sungbacteria bacterium]
MEVEHLERLNKYYNFTRWKFNWFLGGSRHFGFYPERTWIPTDKAQALMQDLVAEKVGAHPGQRLLDAGCGQGITAVYLAKKYGCFVTGVTVVPYEVEEANTLARKFDVSSKIKIALADYAQVTFPDNSFDGVYSQESLVHAMDIEKTLKELYRVLKPNGRVAFFEYSMADDTKFSEEELQTVNDMSYASAMHSFTRMRHGAFEKFMQSAGLRNIQVENISEEVGQTVRNYEKMAKLLYALNKPFGLTSRMPNLTAAARMVKFGEKDLIRYNIYTAEK